jgi:acyl-CoA synthetase (AMP-forming)/AMP-acid ligase II
MDWLLEKIEKFDERIAVIYKDRTYTYKQLSEQIKSYSLLLAEKKIKKGEVVAIRSDYSFHAISLFFSLVYNKNIVPLISKNDSEIDDKINEANADKQIVLNDLNEIEIIECLSNEKHQYVLQLNKNFNSGLILFSSGITGKPKAMIHNLDSLLDTFRDKLPKKLNFLVFLMFDHIGGLNTLFNCISMGVTFTLPEKRDPAYICELIEKYKVDILPASPTLLNLILMSESHLKFDIVGLKMITYGTEPMPESLLLRLRQILPRTKFLQTFGTSETGIAQVSSRSSTSTFIKIDDPNMDYKVVNDELWLRSKTQVLGYLNSSMERFTDDGWFKTGDLVETAEDGYIKIIGRNSDVINVGGQKVLPGEVESVLLQLPVISDCVVFKEKNSITGEIVFAQVVLNKPISLSEVKKEIRIFCSSRLENFKIPAKVEIVEKINYNDRFKKLRK